MSFAERRDWSAGVGPNSVTTLDVQWQSTRPCNRDPAASLIRVGTSVVSDGRRSRFDAGRDSDQVSLTRARRLFTGA